MEFRIIQGGSRIVQPSTSHNAMKWLAPYFSCPLSFMNVPFLIITHELLSKMLVPDIELSDSLHVNVFLVQTKVLWPHENRQSSGRINNYVRGAGMLIFWHFILCLWITADRVIWDGLSNHWYILYRSQRTQLR